MKSHILVLINGTTKNIDEQLRSAIELHRLNEDDLESIGSHHWDYWYLFHDSDVKDSELQANFPSEPKEFLYNASYVRNLPEDFLTSGVICLDGTWVDLQDFGWRMIDEPSEANNKAMDEWKRKLAEILKSNINEICVEILTHC